MVLVTYDEAVACLLAYGSEVARVRLRGCYRAVPRFWASPANVEVATDFPALRALLGGASGPAILPVVIHP